MYIDSQNLENVDYKKYLGPDWVPSFDSRKAPTIVGNHISWIDIIIQLYMNLPSFVARASTKNVPCVGKYSDFLNCIYVDRVSKESRSNTIEKIAQHQNEYLEGKQSTRLIIWPEGATTNGEYLISFKKGAFISLLPVQPYTHNSHGVMISLNNFVAIALNCCGSPFNIMKYDIYPVFEPNEYFWKTHWEPNKEKENKPTTYARVIREIMMKHSGLKDGNQWKAEDRLDWIGLYNGLNKTELEEFVKN